VRYFSSKTGRDVGVIKYLPLQDPHKAPNTRKMHNVFLYNNKVGGAKGSRTPDLLHAMQALYQLSYGPISKEIRKEEQGS
jgi:hypothetical protein